MTAVGLAVRRIVFAIAFAGGCAGLASLMPPEAIPAFAFSAGMLCALTLPKGPGLTRVRRPGRHRHRVWFR